MIGNVFSTLKKVIVSALAILFINCGFAFAADSASVTPSGTAKQPDINQRGSNIIEVGNLETSSIDADSATVTGAMSAGSVTAGAVSASSVSTSGTVSAGTVSAPTGAITNLNTNRTYVQRTPTADVDATNKKYVDDEDKILSSEIADLETLVNNLDTGSLSGYAIAKKATTSRGHYTVSVSCPSGKIIIGGGCSQSPSTHTAIVSNYPVNSRTWSCRTRDIDTSYNRTTTVYAICVSQ